MIKYVLSLLVVFAFATPVFAGTKCEPGFMQNAEDNGCVVDPNYVAPVVEVKFSPSGDYSRSVDVSPVVASEISAKEAQIASLKAQIRSLIQDLIKQLQAQLAAL